MSITTYSELKTAVANWLTRSDLTSRIPEFISLCEADVKRQLRIRAMENSGTMATAIGITTAALPTGWLEGRVVWLDGTTPKKILKYATPSQFRTLYVQNTTGTPKTFTIIGNNAEFGPTPDAAYTVSAVFYKAFDALSDTTTTNWLLTNAPDAYLFGTMTQAMPFIRNDARMPLWDSQYQRVLEQLRQADARDRHSGGPLMIQTDTGNP